MVLVLFLVLCTCKNWHHRIHILRLAFDWYCLVASYRLVFFFRRITPISRDFSRAPSLRPMSMPPTYTCTLRRGARTHSSSLTHASVATNCSVLSHPIGSIIGFTLLLG